MNKFKDNNSLNCKSQNTKKILLVVKDFVEEKTLLNSAFIKDIKNDDQIFLMIPATVDKEYRKNLNEKYPFIKFIDEWPISNIAIKDKCHYWLKSHLYFVINSYKSVSCMQKTLININLLAKLFFKEKSLFPVICKILKPFFNNIILELLLKILIFPFVLLSYIFYFYIFSSKRQYSSFVKTDISFDTIIFGRPDSAINMLIYNSYSNRQTKIITICRNFDTPSLRGVFAVPSDETWLGNSSMGFLLRKLNRRTNFGTIKIININGDVVAKSRKKTEILKVLYATSAPFLANKEPEKVLKIYDILKKKYGNNFVLTIRLIHSDSIDRYRTLKEVKNVVFDNDDLVYYNTAYNKQMKFLTPSGIEEFKNKLQSYDLVLSSLSTINYEAYSFGVKTCYMHDEVKDKWLIKREHLQLLIKEYNIPAFNNMEEFEHYLDEEFN